MLVNWPRHPEVLRNKVLQLLRNILVGLAQERICRWHDNKQGAAC